ERNLRGVPAAQALAAARAAVDRIPQAPLRAAGLLAPQLQRLTGCSNARGPCSTRWLRAPCADRMRSAAPPSLTPPSTMTIEALLAYAHLLAILTMVTFLASEAAL